MRRREAPRRREATRAGGGRTRRFALALAALALVLAAALAPVGLAQGSSQQREQRRSEAHARKEAERSQKADERRRHKEMRWVTVKERENATILTTCRSITIDFRNFADAPENIVFAAILQGHTVLKRLFFVFDGPTSHQVIPFNAPLGRYQLDVKAKWRTNGVEGSFDLPTKVNCVPEPEFTLEKTQAIAGSGQAPTSAPVAGQVGQTVVYTLTAHNTGNVPLNFDIPYDPRCDPSTMALVSGSDPVAIGGEIVYTCSHTLTGDDQANGSYANTATATATSTAPGPAPVERPSNTVEVTPIASAPKGTSKPPPPVEEPGPSTTPTTPTTPPGTGGGQTGVLGFSASTVPALQGPQGGCVRASFRLSIKSKGVASVTFYLDGHKLKRLTSKNARKGLLSVLIDAAKLRIGVHRVMAQITMTRASAAARAVTASRTLHVARCASSAVTPHFTG